jgi:hypothetical protein
VTAALRLAAALIRCMDMRDQAGAEALVTRLWHADRRRLDAVMAWVWLIEAARRRGPAVPLRRGPGRPEGSGRLQPCGTEAAYDRHLYRGEVPCRACVEAERNRKARQREGARRAA